MVEQDSKSDQPEHAKYTSKENEGNAYWFDLDFSQKESLQ